MSEARSQGVLGTVENWTVSAPSKKEKKKILIQTFCPKLTCRLRPSLRQADISFSKNFFIYLWLYWVVAAALRLSLVVANRGYSSCDSQASPCGGSSCCGPRGSRVHGLSSCGTQTQLSCDTWDVLGPGTEPVSSANS